MDIIARIKRLVIMSSSHRKKAPASEALPCPEYGKTQMIHIVETCRFEDGLTIRKLGHYKCRTRVARFVG